MDFYASCGPGIGGRLRARPEDFVVSERGVHAPQAQAEGKYTLALVESTDWETHRLVRTIASRLGISERQVFYAGTKDKRAVTTQHMAIRAAETDVRALDLRGVRVLETRRVDRAPKIGELSGNAFDIVVRDLAVPLDDAVARATAVAAELERFGGFPNFFGMQRFGSARPVTHRIGEAILRGDHRSAVEMYLGGLNDPGASPGLERGVAEHMQAHPDDAVGALQTLPRTLTTIFVYAFQSLLFNQVIGRRRDAGLSWNRPVEGDLVMGADPTRLPDADTIVPVTAANLATITRAAAAGKAFVTGPIHGFDARLAEGAPGEIERAVLAAAGCTAESFRLLDTPWWSAHGTRRAMVAPIHDLHVSGGRDDLGDHVRFRFSLPKGCYATCVLREFLKAPAG